MRSRRSPSSLLARRHRPGRHGSGSRELEGASRSTSTVGLSSARLTVACPLIVRLSLHATPHQAQPHQGRESPQTVPLRAPSRCHRATRRCLPPGSTATWAKQAGSPRGASTPVHRSDEKSTSPADTRQGRRQPINRPSSLESVLAPATAGDRYPQWPELMDLNHAAPIASCTSSGRRTRFH